MEQKRQTNHYDENFRRMVVQEYLRTGCSKMDLLRKYHIKSKSAIQTWIQLYGYTDIHILNQKSIKFANKNLILQEAPNWRKYAAKQIALCTCAEIGSLKYYKQRISTHPHKARTAYLR